MDCLKWLFYETPETEEQKKESKDYTNYYYLSLIFNQESQSWSIHGLWPQYSKNSYPTYCKNVTFDINLLEPIINELKNEWYSTEEPDEDFWKHEWQKHGSCMFTPMNELQYFNKALILFDSIKDNNGLINNFKTSNTQSMIPYDQNFNIIIDLHKNN